MHTPGPWVLNDEGSSIVVSGGPNNDDIADFSYAEEHTVSITRAEALANARLFIAAPRLLRTVGLVLAGIRSRTLPNPTTIDLSREATESFPLRALSDILAEAMDQAVGP